MSVIASTCDYSIVQVSPSCMIESTNHRFSLTIWRLSNMVVLLLLKSMICHHDDDFTEIFSRRMKCHMSRTGMGELDEGNIQPAPEGKQVNLPYIAKPSASLPQADLLMDPPPIKRHDIDAPEPGHKGRHFAAVVKKTGRTRRVARCQPREVIGTVPRVLTRTSATILPAQV